MGVRKEKVYLRAGVCICSPSLVFFPIPLLSLYSSCPAKQKDRSFGWRGGEKKWSQSHKRGKKGKGGEYKNLWCVKDEGRGECKKKTGSIAPCKMGANILLLFLGKRLRGEVFAGEEGGGEDKRRRRRKRKRVWIVKCIFLSD